MLGLSTLVRLGHRTGPEGDVQERGAVRQLPSRQRVGSDRGSRSVDWRRDGRADGRGEGLSTIGETLRDARLALGRSVAEVSQATCIREVYLEALEDDRFDVLGEAVYARGFLRNYAIYLGLNPQPFLDVFKSYERPSESVRGLLAAPIDAVGARRVASGNVIRDGMGPGDPGGAATTSGASDRSPRSTPQRRKRKSADTQGAPVEAEPWLRPAAGTPSWSFGRIVTAALAAVLLGVIAFNLFGGSGRSAPAARSASVAATPTTAAPTRSTVGTHHASGVTVSVHYKGVCWTQAIVDGRVLYTGIPPIGTVKQFHGVHSVRLVLGLATNARVVANGRTMNSPGARVWRVTFTPTSPRSLA